MTWRPISELTDEIWDEDLGYVILGNPRTGFYHSEFDVRGRVSSVEEIRDDGRWTHFFQVPPIEDVGTAK